MDALERVQIVGQNRDNAAVRLTMSAGGLDLSMSAQDVGNAQESVDAKFEGSELTVAFNPTFLHDGIDAVDTEEVALETVDPLKPATLHAADNGDFLYLLMPVRTSPNRDTAEAATRSVLRRSPLARRLSLSRRRGPRARSGSGVHGAAKAGQHARSRRVNRARIPSVGSATHRSCATAQAIVRAEIAGHDRLQLFEAELRATGRNRISATSGRWRAATTRAAAMSRCWRRPRVGEGGGRA
jgi:hypothetical protein